jgi:hypothetical protein
MYSSTISLTSVIDGGVWLTPRPGRFTPRERDPVPVVLEAVWTLEPVWTGVENLAPNWIRSPDCSAHSKSLKTDCAYINWGPGVV